MDARELDEIMAEAQALVDAEWEQFYAEWLGERAPEPVAEIPPAEEVNA